MAPEIVKKLAKEKHRARTKIDGYLNLDLSILKKCFLRFNAEIET